MERHDIENASSTSQHLEKKDPDLSRRGETTKNAVVDASDEFMMIYTLVSKIDKGKLIIPQCVDAARQQKSRLIELIMLNYPLLPLCLKRESSGVLTVVSGTSMLKGIYEYAKDGYQLEGLERFDRISGKRFSELDDATKDALFERKLHCYVLGTNVPELVVFDACRALRVACWQSIHAR